MQKLQLKVMQCAKCWKPSILAMGHKQPWPYDRHRCLKIRWVKPCHMRNRPRNKCLTFVSSKFIPEQKILFECYNYLYTQAFVGRTHCQPLKIFLLCTWFSSFCAQLNLCFLKTWTAAMRQAKGVGGIDYPNWKFNKF